MLRARLEELEMRYPSLRASYEECIDDDDVESEADIFASVNKKCYDARDIYLSVKSKLMAKVDESSPIEAITASTSATLNQSLVLYSYNI